MIKAQVQLLENNGYVSAARAAAASEMVVTTIHRWLSDGRVRGTKVATYWYVDVKSLLFHLNNRIIQEEVAKKLGSVGEAALRDLGGQDAVEAAQPQHHD